MGGPIVRCCLTALKTSSFAILRVFDVLFGILGFDAAVECLGAGGGDRSPGINSIIGRSLSRILLRSASNRPSDSGIHVPEIGLC